MDFARIVSDALLDTVAHAVVATDREGVIRLWNRGAERIFGFSSAEAVGQSLDLIIPERLRERHWQGFERVVATGKSRYGDGDLLSVPGLHKDGRRISLEFTIVPLKGTDGGTAGFAAVMHDVTARFEEIRSLKKQLASATGREPG